jgi:hypothetical protein
VHPRTICVPETPPDKVFKTPQTLQTYKDFKDSLSEGEGENFFYFVKEKTNNLEKPINDLEAWLASKNAAKQNRWEIYYSNYQEEKISESRKTTRQNENLENYSPSKIEWAIAEFKNRHRKREQEFQQIQEQEQLKNAENNPDNQKNE